MGEKVKPTYRQQFAKKAKAEEYDRVAYGSDSYSDILWEIEKAQLVGLLKEFRKTHDHIDYLDFAAGTGRIISFMEDKVNTATGIEISQAMAELARKKLVKGRVICADITNDAEEIEGRYDLITAFRFILNAEPPLRVRALKALAARLKDETSVLIFNNHSNLFSHKLLLWPLHKLRRLGKGYQTEGNYMINVQARRLADEAGLTIGRVLGCGVLSAKALRLMPFDTVRRLEKQLARRPMLRPFCGNQMYVAKVKR